MRGLGSFLVVAGIVSLAMLVAEARFVGFDWFDHWCAATGIIIRVALMMVGGIIIGHSFYTGRRD